MKKISFIKETLGMYPYGLRMKQALIAIRGEEDVPPSKAGLSSLKQFYPKYGPRLWSGREVVSGKVIITNLFNRTPTPIEKGWSVKKTQVNDFRGRQLTYDSHNGTDFSIVPGTKVLTATPGKVVRIISEFNRGGLKIFIDHGEGLMTCYAHLARTLVKVGDDLHAGQKIAFSGYSGFDALLTFPWGVPHVHFNVWLNGEPVDPFAKDENEVSMWKENNFPQVQIENKNLKNQESVYVAEKIKEALSFCKTKASIERIESIKDIQLKAAELIAEMNYYPTRFTRRINIYDKVYPRRPVLDLPFSKNDFNGVVFLDEI